MKLHKCFICERRFAYVKQMPASGTVPKKSRVRRRIRRCILLALLVYLCAAVLPYAHPAAVVDLPENWRDAASSETNVDSAAILETGSEALDVRLRLISSAQTIIRAGTYLYDMDDSGTQITAALLNAADRGVQVRLIVDGMFGLIHLRADPAAYALGSHPNVEIRFYNPIDLMHPAGLNVRYHEKFFVVDDAWLILGGRNVSDEFLSQEGNPHYNYDRDVLIHRERAGRSACDLVADYFDEMWASELCRTRYESAPNAQKEAAACAAEELRAAWRKIAEERDLAQIDAATFAPVEKSILLSGQIDARPKAPLVYAKMIDLMMEAQDRVVLQSPYFVMDSAMRDALNGVCSQPVQVTLLTNSAASGNNIITSADGVFHRGMTNRMNAIVLEQQTDYSMHTKSVLIDDDLSIFGSFNVDPRSAYIDTELMLAVYSKPLAAQLEENMNALVEQSSPVSAQAQVVFPEIPQKSMPAGKGAMIYLLSPFISLFRYLT